MERGNWHGTTDLPCTHRQSGLRRLMCKKEMMIETRIFCNVPAGYPYGDGVSGTVV